MKNKTKLIAKIMLVVLLLTSALTLTACIEKEGLEAGFEWDHAEIGNRYFCAYKSHKKEFDINDVTLTFYYGGSHGIEDSFGLYFENEKGDVYLIKKIENHNPDDYKMEWEGMYERKVFSHFEVITIPKELFVDDSGYIWFFLGREYIIDSNNNSSKIDTLGGGAIRVDYKKSGDMIILSDEYYCD